MSDQIEITQKAIPYVMICAAACFFSILSRDTFLISIDAKIDPTRIAAAIVTGVGFIGAGFIIQMREGNHQILTGMTNAASIWVGCTKLECVVEMLARCQLLLEWVLVSNTTSWLLTLASWCCW